MANIKSQIKRNRQNEKHRLRNKSVRSELKTRVKATLEAPAETAAAIYQATQKRIDMAAAKGIIHPKTAARRKSRLTKRIRAAS
jgi:small subunit ribosomal protein S20